MNEDCLYVEAIARCGSISKAAREAHISQPGLSQRLKRLESELGCELFDRRSTPLQLTPSGEVYLRYARSAMAAEETMQREVRSMTRRKYRYLHVGVSESRANALLSEAVVDFYESHLGCMLVFHGAETSEELHRLFVDGIIDCAVLTPIVLTPSSYRIERICCERLLMAVSKDFSVPHFVEKAGNGISRVTARDLEGIPFVLPSCGHYVDTLISRFIDDTDVRLDIAIRGCAPEFALRLVKEGLGATIIPSTLLGDSQLRVFEVDGLDVGCDLNYIRMADRPTSAEEALFFSLVRKYANVAVS